MQTVSKAQFPEELVSELRALRQREAEENRDIYRLPSVPLKDPFGKTPGRGWEELSFDPNRDASWIHAAPGTNMGRMLNLPWVVGDIDVKNAELADRQRYSKIAFRVAASLGIDVSQADGRKSVGAPTHYWWQIKPEQEDLCGELPNRIVLTQLRGATYRIEFIHSRVEGNKLFPKQVVRPGSAYDGNDLLMRANPATGELVSVSTLPVRVTTPPFTDLTLIPRLNSFATLIFILEDYLTAQGGRQEGWRIVTANLARRVYNSEQDRDPLDPFGTVEDCERFIEIACDYFGDEEAPMRKHTLRDAIKKLRRNPECKLPGFPAMEEAFGLEQATAIKALIDGREDDFEGAMEKLSKLAIYMAGGKYINREQYEDGAPGFVHKATDAVIDFKNYHIDGVKAGAPIRMLEVSRHRINVTRVVNVMEPPNLDGSMSKIAGRVVAVKRGTQEIVSDDSDYAGHTSLVFNEWRDFEGPTLEHPDPAMRDLLTGPNGYWFRLLSSVTRDNAKQMHVVTSSIAYKIQHPTRSLQMSLLLLGEQNTGKSFVGTVLKKVIDGERLNGMVVAANADLLAKADKFLLGSIANSLITIVDEAKRNKDGSSMVKLINRGGILQAQNKYEPLKQVMFRGLMVYTTNEMINLGDLDSQDRAIFVTRSVDHKFLGKQRILPDAPSWAELMRATKRFAQEFDDLLNDPQVRAHFRHFFATYPVDKAEIESIEFSSGSDADIIEATASKERRAMRTFVERRGIRGEWNRCWYEEDAAEWLLERYGGKSGAPTRNMPDAGRFTSGLVKAGLFTRWNALFRPLVPWGTAIEITRQKTGLDVSPVREPTPEECEDTLPESKLILPPPRKF